ncbi:MAG: UvrD-helicase domain-containing protein, partial [Planctomycetes bacterium]|nr:UvrD-helicase domain-containing protein [Planctomycetota bacterium]
EGSRLATELQRAMKHFQRIDPQAWRALSRVLGPLLGALRSRLKQRGWLRFDDLLAEMASLLERDAELRSELRSSLDQLLVDEVQDTDPLQFEIIGHLTLGGSDQDRPGLFVVGDPKQTIYGFRRADIAAYSRFVEHLQREANAVVAPLFVNFRSVPVILDEVRSLLEGIMVHEPGRQAAFEPLLPSPERISDLGYRDGDRRSVEHWCVDGGNAEGHRQLEARAIAAEIASLRASATEGFSLSSVAILLRAATKQEIYLAALRDAGIPYLVDGDRSFYSRREINDATAAAATLLDPLDDVSLLTFLRSPMVALPDHAILPLWRRGLPGLVADLGGTNGPRALELLPALIDAVGREADSQPKEASLPAWPGLLFDALLQVEHLRRLHATGTTDRFIEAFRQLLQPEAIESARWLGEHRVANLERFFERLERALTTGSGSKGRVLRTLRNGIRDARRESEGSPGDASLDAVRVMTIHKAKGLDFEQVFLPALCQGSMGSTSTNEILRHGDDLEVCLAGLPTLSLDRAQEQRDGRESAERIRTWYVAVTRPKRRLVTLGSWPNNSDKPWSQAMNFAELLVHREGGLPSAPSPDADEADVDPSRSDGRRFRWIRDSETEGTVEPVSHGRPGKVSNPVEAHDPRTWQQRRAAANARQERAAMRRPSDDGDCISTIDWDHEGAQPTPGPAEFRSNAEVARRIGSAVHRALEIWNFGASALDEVARILPVVTAEWGKTLSPVEQAELSSGVGAMLDRFASSEGLQILSALPEEDLHRELPLLLSKESTDRFVETWTGSIDLLYREPSGRWTIVDYKTDAIMNDTALDQAIRGHAGQAAVYAEAVRRALQLDTAALRIQLWFLAAGRIVDVPL